MSKKQIASQINLEHKFVAVGFSLLFAVTLFARPFEQFKRLDFTRFYSIWVEIQIDFSLLHLHVANRIDYYNVFGWAAVSASMFTFFENEEICKHKMPNSHIATTTQFMIPIKRRPFVSFRSY